MTNYRIGDSVIPIVGPYEGRAGTIKSRRADGHFEVELPATEYASAVVGHFDPRNLRLVTKAGGA